MKLATSVSYRQLGASMIEVLVSLTIVAFGLLGLAGLQARSMSFQKDSFDRKAAAEMAAQLGERIRANYDGFKEGNYDLTLLPADPTPNAIPPCANANLCTAVEMAAADWAMWTMALRARLPASGAYLTTLPLVNGERIQLNVVLAWQEGQITNANQQVDQICGAQGITDPRFRCFLWILHP